MEFVPETGVIVNLTLTLENDMYSLKAKYINSTKNETEQIWSFSDFNYKLFESAMSLVLNDISDVKYKLEDNESLKSKLSITYIGLVVGIMNSDEQQLQIATIKLADSVKVQNVYMKKPDELTELKTKRQRNKKANEESNLKTAEMKITSCQIVFEDGFIRHILVKGKIGDEEITFSNGYAIGITTRTNIQNFQNICLFNENSINDIRYILLKDVIEYARVPQLKTNDFSPSNVVVSLFPKQPIALNKSSNQKLFHLNIFSDFAGIKEDNPNGLVQFELDKRINIITKRRRFFRRNFGYGVFTYLTPFAQLSKIEENNRYLPLSKGSIGSADSVYFSNSLQIDRHNRFYVGASLNLLNIEMSALKVHFNYMFAFGLSQLRDSVVSNIEINRINQPINTLVHGGEINFIFNPEMRWSFSVNNRFTWHNNLNDQIQYFSLSGNELSKMNNVLMRHELLFAWLTNGENYIFGRYRLNYELKNWMNNYSEFQIGYSMYLKSSKSTK